MDIFYWAFHLANTALAFEWRRDTGHAEWRQASGHRIVKLSKVFNTEITEKKIKPQSCTERG